MSGLEVPAWLISFFTALIADFFGSYIAIKKFKKEKIWQEKYQSYQEILSALEAILLWSNETYCYQKMILNSYNKPVKFACVKNSHKWTLLTSALDKKHINT